MIQCDLTWEIRSSLKRALFLVMKHCM